MPMPMFTTSTRIPLTWLTSAGAAYTDLENASYTRWVPVPRDAKQAIIYLGWTGTDTPSGTIAIVICGHGIDGTAGAAYSPQPTTQPAGAAGTVVWAIDPFERYIGLTYTASAGGDGDVFTDDTGTSGTKPYIEFRV